MKLARRFPAETLMYLAFCGNALAKALKDYAPPEILAREDIDHAMKVFDSIATGRGLPSLNNQPSRGVDSERDPDAFDEKKWGGEDII